MYLYSVLAMFAFSWGLYGVLIVSHLLTFWTQRDTSKEGSSMDAVRAGFKKISQLILKLFFLSFSLVLLLPLTNDDHLSRRITLGLLGDMLWRMSWISLSMLFRQLHWQWLGSCQGTTSWASLNPTKEATLLPLSAMKFEKDLNSRVESPSLFSLVFGACTYVYFREPCHSNPPPPRKMWFHCWPTPPCFVVYF